MKGKSVDSLYREGRTYPYGRHSAQDPYPPARATIPKPDPSLQRPQAPEDQHGPGYDNDVSIKGWLRNGDALSKPSADRAADWASGKLHLREGDRKGQSRSHRHIRGK